MHSGDFHLPNNKNQIALNIKIKNTFFLCTMLYLLIALKELKCTHHLKSPEEVKPIQSGYMKEHF